MKKGGTAARAEFSLDAAFGIRFFLSASELLGEGSCTNTEFTLSPTKPSLAAIPADLPAPLISGCPVMFLVPFGDPLDASQVDYHPPMLTCSFLEGCFPPPNLPLL